MAVMIGHASIDENKNIKGGAAGDQTGKEVCTRTWYSKPWTSVIRPKDSAKAEKIAKAMEQACANNKIGYDQNQRTTLYTQAKAVNWDLSKIATACECDCSSLVAVCVNAAGITVSKDIYTGNQKTALANTGAFVVLTDSAYISKSDFLKRGDILLGAGHTAIVLTDGSKAGASAAPVESKPSTESNIAKKTVAEIAKEVLAGKWGNGADRKARLVAAGYDYKAVQDAVNEKLSKPVEPVYHTVQAGETLARIANMYNTTYTAIAKLNGIENPNLIREGQKLRIK